MENNKDISSVWRALNTFTRETKGNPRHFTADALKDYFLFIAETLVKSHLIAISTTPVQTTLLIS